MTSGRFAPRERRRHAAAALRNFAGLRRAGAYRTYRGRTHPRSAGLCAWSGAAARRDGHRRRTLVTGSDRRAAGRVCRPGRRRAGRRRPAVRRLRPLAAALVVADRSLGGAALVLAGVPVVLLWLGERQYVTRSRTSVYELRAKHAELQDALARMQRSYVSTVTSLARTIEAKDPYTGGHTERVAEIACLIAAQ